MVEIRVANFTYDFNRTATTCRTAISNADVSIYLPYVYNGLGHRIDLVFKIKTVVTVYNKGRVAWPQRRFASLRLANKGLLTDIQRVVFDRSFFKDIRRELFNSDRVIIRCATKVRVKYC